MAAALLINGVDAATLGLTLAEAPGWLDAPPRQTPIAPIIGRGGAKKLAPPVEQPRKLTLRGMVRATTVAGARTNVDALKLALLAEPLTLTFADHTDRIVYVTLESFSAPTLAGSFVQESLPVEAVLTAYDPLSYDTDLAGVLQYYAPGDTITGESFTRSTVAHQMDTAGIYQSAAINVKRDSHFTAIGGTRGTLLEAARTNSILQSRDLTVTWTAVGTGTATQDAVGLDGTANSATTITDTDAAVASYRGQFVTVPVDSATHCIAFWIKKDTDQTRMVQCYAQIAGGTSVTAGVHLNTQTGAFSLPAASGTVTRRVIDGGLRWIVEICLVNNSTAGNTALNARVYPAIGTALGTQLATATGSCVVGQVQVELNSAFYSSPIFTTTVAVTRASDLYSLPFTTPPQEMTVYAKFVEGGTVRLVNATVASISASPAAVPAIRLYAPSGVYGALHQNATASVVSSLAAAPVIGNTVELVARLFGDGSVDITQSVNSGASTAGAQSAALAPATAWSGQLLWLNSIATSNFGFTALQSFKIVSGARTLDEMRAAMRLPLGTGPIRPVITIHDAATNPVISLYNAAGAVIASMTLTITTILGDTLVIDMDAKTIKKNGVNQIAALTAGDFFTIDPADQVNFGGAGPSINSSSGIITVSYRRSWR